MNPFLERQKRRNTGIVSEKRASKSLGAKLNPASGALKGAKGDSVLGEYLLEMKSTTNQSIALQVSWLSKISKEALDQGKIPGVVISFVNGEGKPVSPINAEWVMVPKSIFIEKVV